MAIYKIPVSNDADKIFSVVLDNITYDFRLKWNTRDESWYLYIALANQPFFVKTKLTTFTDVLKSYRAHNECPKGVLKVIDVQKKYGRITRNGFETGRFAIVYIEKNTVYELNDNGFEIL